MSSSSILQLTIQQSLDGGFPRYFDSFGEEFLVTRVSDFIKYSSSSLSSSSSLLSSSLSSSSSLLSFNNYNMIDNNNIDMNNINNMNDMIQYSNKLRIFHGMGQLTKPLNVEDILVYTAICIGLIMVGGITSGLNVSLLAIDPLKIKLMKKSRLELDRKIVDKIGPLIENHHLLLVTLLVANAMAMEALPIFLNQMVAPWMAVLISVTFVLIFGEILPQALFSSDPLKHGYRFAYLVRMFEFILYPICRPIAWLLDRCLKHKEKRPILFRHHELKEMIAFIRSDEEFKETRAQFTEHELAYLDGVLKLRNTTVKDERTKWQDVKTLPEDFVLDQNGLKEIAETGFSRIPVYRRRENNLIGICLVKDLVAVDPSQKLTLGNFVRKKIAAFYPHTSCIEALRDFERFKVHFAVITKHATLVINCIQAGRDVPESVQFIGAITLEDMMELLMGTEIEDEYDEKTYLAPMHIEVGKKHRHPRHVKDRRQFHSHFGTRERRSSMELAPHVKLTQKKRKPHPSKVSKNTLHPQILVSASPMASGFECDESQTESTALLSTRNNISRPSDRYYHHFRNPQSLNVWRDNLQHFHTTNNKNMTSDHNNHHHHHHHHHSHINNIEDHENNQDKKHLKSEKNLNRLWGESDHLANIYKSNTPILSGQSMNIKPLESIGDSHLESECCSPSERVSPHDSLLSTKLPKERPILYGSFSLPNVMVNVDTDKDDP